jgi:hypothetical protein
VDPRGVVETSFSQPQRCYGHCDQPATLRFLNSGEPAVACYTCPAGYVSKVMVYGRRDARETLREFVTMALGGQPIKEEDIRTATRHPWDLDIAGFEMKVAYWTQNYRGSKSTDPNRQTLFVCYECGSTFVKPLTAADTRCANCRG